ncbi:MAG: hypothetical protein K940chlam3_00685 [Chlamydiae bacterium]|nr:hypothetical protein [Chlamydiota bacterium]
MKLSRLFIFFYLISFGLFADEQAFIVDAKVMEFDANTQLLKAKDVVIAFKNGAKLMSHSAELDFESLSGVMSSGEDDEFVVFTGMITDKNEKPRPIVVKGKVMIVEIQESETNSSQQRIEVVAEKDVEILYDRDFTAYGDRAVFRNEKVDELDFSSLTDSGTLTLEGESEEHLCRVEHKNGDVIEALRMSFLPFENQIDGWHVHGSITSIGKLREVIVKSDHICWLPKEKVIRLDGKSLILDEEVGSLMSNGSLEIIREGPSENAPIKKVVAKGEVRFDHSDEEHSLGGFGKMVLDYQEKKLVITSPKDKNGFTSPSQQAFFKDSVGKIYADSFEITYELEKNQVKPIDVLIKGNVRMQNQYIPDTTIREILEQYAIADVVKYSPSTNKMILKASRGNRVLYYDKTKGIQVSAPGLFIVRGSNDEFKVRGKGNVRLKFTQNEIAELQKYFPFLQ